MRALRAGRRRMSPMKPKLQLALTIALIVILLDHLTKWLIVQNIPMGDEIAIIPGIFDLVHGRNTGAAFGVLSGWDSPFRDWFFYGMGLIALVFLYQYLKTTHHDDKVTITALGLILGGASGNIIDRAVRGSVVDFL